MTRILALILLFFGGLLLVGIAARSSVNRTEVGHLGAAAYFWQTGNFDLFNVNPPTARILSGLPIYLAGAKYDWKSYSPRPQDRSEWPVGSAFIAANEPEKVRWMVFLGRCMLIPVILLGGWFGFLFENVRKCCSAVASTGAKAPTTCAAGSKSIRKQHRSESFIPVRKIWSVSASGPKVPRRTRRNWLVKNDRLVRHPLLALSLFNADTDPRHARRPLSPEEFEYMLEAADKAGSVEGISGGDRRMFYILAAWTGFRKGELGSVTLRHFKLDGEYPTLTIQAAYSKRKREDSQFLHPDVVAEFNAWIDEKNPKPDEILFPVSEKTCPFERKTATMVEKDLASAREVWINEANSDAERSARESSDFLKYVDSHGRYADFHGLRHTFVTNLARANVSPKMAQTLARHSDIKLTMSIYTHVAPVEQAQAIKSLPGFGQAKSLE